MKKSNKILKMLLFVKFFFVYLQLVKNEVGFRNYFIRSILIINKMKVHNFIKNVANLNGVWEKN